MGGQAAGGLGLGPDLDPALNSIFSGCKLEEVDVVVILSDHL